MNSFHQHRKDTRQAVERFETAETRKLETVSKVRRFVTQLYQLVD